MMKQRGRLREGGQHRRVDQVEQPAEAHEAERAYLQQPRSSSASQTASSTQRALPGSARP